MRVRYFIVLLMSVVLLPGCALQAEKYEISAENIQILKRSGNSKIAVGKFTGDKTNQANLNNLTFRGSGFASPYKESYEAYLQAALTADLKQASRYSDKSNVKVTGVLIKNEFDASGVNVGIATLTARIIVHNNGVEKYNKVLSHTQEWESFFVGISAFPAAKIGYVDTYRGLMKKIYSDKDFVKACK